MYRELSEEYTKTRYSQILDETQRIAEVELEKDLEEGYSDMWRSVISQIVDIRKKMVDSHFLLSWEEIYERYTIGVVGLEYFDIDSEIHRRLCDIFYGAVHYGELK